MFGDGGIQVAQKMGKTRLRCRVFMMASETLLFELISKIPVHKMASMCSLESYLTLPIVFCARAFDDGTLNQHWKTSMVIAKENVRVLSRVS